MILQNPENKRDNLQDLQNAGVMVFFGALRRGHKPVAGGFCLYLKPNPIVRWVLKDVIQITSHVRFREGKRRFAPLRKMWDGERAVRAVYIPPFAKARRMGHPRF